MDGLDEDPPAPEQHHDYPRCQGETQIMVEAKARGQEGQKSCYHRGGDGLAPRADATTARAGLAPF